ncbi:MAG: hypothetical protein U0S36_02515 [Candidatus Nanopelagicales bacterium]
MPSKVVLRAVHGIQFPYAAGASWTCPADVRANGYRDELPDYGGHPISWGFLLKPPTKVPQYWANYVWFTSFYGKVPELGATGTGGDYAPLTPGVYRAMTDAEYGDITVTNYPDVAFTSTTTFRAKYWSHLSMSVRRAGRTTTVRLSGRRDAIVNMKQSYGGTYPSPRMNVAARGYRVAIYRDGVKVTSVTLNRGGRAVVSFRDAKGRHTYRAVMRSTSRNWPAKASVRR